MKTSLTNHLLFSHAWLKQRHPDAADSKTAEEFAITLRDWVRFRKEGSLDKLLSTFVRPLLQLLELEIGIPTSAYSYAFPIKTSWGNETDALLILAPSADDLGALEPGSGQWMIRAVNLARSAASWLHLSEADKRWIILTNGHRWRLLDAYALRRYEGYVEFDLDQLVSDPVDLGAANLFLACFHREVFEKDENNRQNLHKLIEDSSLATRRVEDHLKASVCDNLELPGSSDGILAQLCLGIVKATGRHSFSEDECDAIYLDAIQLLYRLLFICYGEAWGLLPLRHPEYKPISMASLIDKVFGLHRHGITEKGSTRLWDQLEHIFEMLDVGDDDLDLPAYNGGLFRNDDKPYLGEYSITDEYLSEAIFLLGYIPLDDKHDNGNEYEKIDYRDLSVRHLGSLYEGMIEYRLFVAKEKLLARRTKAGEVAFLPASEETPRSTDQPIAKGDIYFAQSPGERRSTGTHYTPEEFVDKLVRWTLLEKITEKLAPLANDLERMLKEHAAADEQNKPGIERHIEGELEAFVQEQLLSLRIADISMGSGHFLVGAAHHFTNSILEILSSIPWKPRGYSLEPSYWRRLIVERCLYGVDIKPMAVELAKLSMWLISMASSRPLSFLDHHLREGDSIVGARLADLEEYLPESAFFPTSNKASQAIDSGQIQLRVGSGPGEQVIRAGRIMTAIAAIESTSVSDIQSQHDQYLEARQALSPLLRLADVITARNLGCQIADVEVKQYAQQVMANLEKGSAEEGDLATRASEFLRGRQPIHWELEFPEVFIHPPNDPDAAERPAGFDVIIGNPPYLGGLRIRSEIGGNYLEHLMLRYPPGKGRADLCTYFLRQSFDLIPPGGSVGLVTTNTISQGDARSGGLKVVIEAGGMIRYADRYVPWPGDASVEVVMVSIWKPQQKLPPFQSAFLDGDQARFISSRLDNMPEEDAKKLKGNDNKAFNGTYVLGKGFFLSREERDAILESDPNCGEVILSIMNGDELNSNATLSSDRYTIYFRNWPLEEAKKYRRCYEWVERNVRPEREQAKVTQFREKWWQYARTRPNLYASISKLTRVLAKSQVSELHALAFLSNGQIYDTQLVIFPFDDYFHFALLQSSLHEAWARMHGSTLETRQRYTPSTCFQTFPFPQGPGQPSLQEADKTGSEYYQHRQHVMVKRNLGLTKVYNFYNNPDCADRDITRLRELHITMDRTILACYGWGDIDLEQGFRANERGKMRFMVSEKARHELLSRLMELNHQIAAQEELESPSPSHDLSDAD